MGKDNDSDEAWAAEMCLRGDVPLPWIGNESHQPSWVAKLNSHLKLWPRMLNAFPTALNHCAVSRLRTVGIQASAVQLPRPALLNRGL